METSIGKLVSQRVGRVKEYESAEGTWVTATYKEEVARPLRLAEMGLEGDEVADRVNHGGVDKAVLVYGAAHYGVWKIEGFGYGALGENWVVEGWTEERVCLGDRMRVGGAVVEVSQPRQPCWKQARRWGVRDLVVQVVESGRTGWYVRVVEPGVVQMGDAMELIARPQPEWTVQRANEIFHFARQDKAAMAALREVPTLAESWKATLAKRISMLA
jgi:MOSC domain-containing protein YiiM